MQYIRAAFGAFILVCGQYIMLRDELAPYGEHASLVFSWFTMVLALIFFSDKPLVEVDLTAKVERENDTRD